MNPPGWEKVHKKAAPRGTMDHVKGGNRPSVPSKLRRPDIKTCTTPFGTHKHEAPPTGKTHRKELGS